jgi:hypothetical protein
MASLPVPRPAAGSPSLEMLAVVSRRLSRSGIDTGVDDYAQLNAIAAQLYGLTSDQFAHVLSTFPLVATSIRDSCLKAFQQQTRKRGNTEAR